MPNPLTPEQIELLRSLPRKDSGLGRRLHRKSDADVYGALDAMVPFGWVHVVLAVEGWAEFYVTFAGRVLLATIDSLHERAIETERRAYQAGYDAGSGLKG